MAEKRKVEIPEDKVAIIQPAKEGIDKDTLEKKLAEHREATSEPVEANGASDKNGPGPTILGYKPEELLKAPTSQTPQPASKAPATQKQRLLILAGFSVIALGVIGWFFLPFFAGLLIAIAGAGTVAIGTLVRFR